MYRPLPPDLRLAAVLPAGSLYAVGGRVRDELRADLERSPAPTKDLDYVVTGLPLEEIAHRLAPVGRIDVVGASFSVLKLTFDGQTVDIALPRRERSIGVGHRDFEVHSGPDVTLEQDLGRRDFRMNMLARALPSGELVDPYGGEADIRARRIDILTPESFAEDPLRMLRAAQFSARFEYEVTARDAGGDGRSGSAGSIRFGRTHQRRAGQALHSGSPGPPLGWNCSARPACWRNSGPSFSRGLGSNRTSGTPSTSGTTAWPPSTLRRLATNLTLVCFTPRYRQAQDERGAALLPARAGRRRSCPGDAGAIPLS